MLSSDTARKPLIVIVSGAPGSGKTTLAQKLAKHLQIPHVPRDEVLRGIEMTKGGDIERGALGIEAYFALLIEMTKLSISFVTDGTLYRGLSDKDIKERLLHRAEVINVHVRAKNELQRFYDRESNRPGWSSEWVDGHVEHLNKVYHKAVEPLELGAPVIEVDATAEYEPSLSNVIARIRSTYKDTREGIVEPEEYNKSNSKEES